MGNINSVKYIQLNQIEEVENNQNKTVNNQNKTVHNEIEEVETAHNQIEEVMNIEYNYPIYLLNKINEVHHIDDEGVLNLTNAIILNKFQFYDNKKIKKLIIGPNIKIIPEYCFCKCSNIEEIDFTGSTVNILEKKCFQFCHGLKEITLPRSISYIQQLAFNKCTSLETINLINVDHVHYLSKNIFTKCFSLENIDVIDNDVEFFSLKIIYMIREIVKENNDIKINVPDDFKEKVKKYIPNANVNIDSFILK